MGNSQQIVQSIVVGEFSREWCKKLPSPLPILDTHHRFGDRFRAAWIRLFAARQLKQNRVALVRVSIVQVQPRHLFTGTRGLVDLGGPLQSGQSTLPITFFFFDASDLVEQLQIVGLEASGFQQRLATIFVVVADPMDFGQRQKRFDRGPIGAAAFFELFDQLFCRALELRRLGQLLNPAQLARQILAVFVQTPIDPLGVGHFAGFDVSLGKSRSNVWIVFKLLNGGAQRVDRFIRFALRRKQSGFGQPRHRASGRQFFPLLYPTQCLVDFVVPLVQFDQTTHVEGFATLGQFDQTLRRFGGACPVAPLCVQANLLADQEQRVLIVSVGQDFVRPPTVALAFDQLGQQAIVLDRTLWRVCQFFNEVVGLLSLFGNLRCLSHGRFQIRRASRQLNAASSGRKRVVELLQRDRFEHELAEIDRIAGELVMTSSEQFKSGFMLVSRGQHTGDMNHLGSLFALRQVSPYCERLVFLLDLVQERGAGFLRGDGIGVLLREALKRLFRFVLQFELLEQASRAQIRVLCFFRRPKVLGDRFPRLLLLFRLVVQASQLQIQLAIVGILLDQRLHDLDRVVDHFRIGQHRDVRFDI